jgi:hypothetical protein
MPFVGVGGAVIGGLLGLGGSLLASDAQGDANAANIQAQAANQEKGLNALQSSDPFKQTTRDAKGGFTTEQPGADDAALARTTLAGGDIERALGVNAADTNFNFKLPTLQASRDVIEGENQAAFGQLQDGMNSIIANRQRTGGGIQLPNSQFEGGTAKALGDFVKSNPRGGEVAAMDLFNKAGTSGLALKNAIKTSLAPQAPAPGYTTGGPGATAANLIAQTPPIQQSADLSSALPFFAGSNIVGQIQQQQQNAQNREFLLDLNNRTVGNQLATQFANQGMNSEGL